MTDKEIISLIRRRRYQILVHSYLYYERDMNLITDDMFDKWCVELDKLQTEYPNLAKITEWDSAFIGWEVGSGAFLPYRHPKIVSIACHLIKDYSKFEPAKKQEVSKKPTKTVKHKLF